VVCNTRACEFFLRTREHLLERSISDLIADADANLIATLWQHLQGERFTLIQAYCIRSDRSYFPAEIAVSRLIAEEACLCFFVRDITLRRQAEEMLRTEHAAIQNAANGIAVADLQGTVEYANPGMARMWGVDEADALVGTDLRRLFRDADAADAMVRETLAEQRTWSGELTAARERDGDFAVQVTAARSRNADGEVVGMVLSLLDITDRRRAESALREAERQRVMIESLGAACHHLGQPATTLLGNLELLRERIKSAPEEVRQLLDAAIQSVAEMGTVLHKLSRVHEYRTTGYLDGAGDSSGESRILKI
jgi:PAS domain S-box-containing protein